MAVACLVGALALSPAIVVSPPWPVLPLVLLSGILEAAYGLCLAAAYRRGALSIAYPIGRGTAPLLVTLGGWMLLDERPTATAFGGAVALGAGLLVLAGAGRRAEQHGAVAFALLTGATIAAYSVVDARAVREVSPAAYLGAVLGVAGLLLAVAIRANRERLRAALPSGARIGVGTIATYLLVLLAFQRAPAGQVATLRESSVLVGLLLARERPARLAWLGAVLVAVGAALAAW